MNEKLKTLRKKAMELPLQPGVYIMKDIHRDIIYIGKAKKLKNRVSQYFGSQNNHADKVKQMVSQVDDFEYIITDSEFEALILECSLIKQHQPKYNILLKDGKGYSYVKIANEKWRRISYALQVEDDGAKYIGPYKTSFYVKQAVEQANAIFRLPTCSRRFPEDFGKARPCLNYHIKLCDAPCTGRIPLAEYNENFDRAVEFLTGSDADSIKTLTEAMKLASEKTEYEKAAQLRDRITAIKRLADKQKVVASKIKSQDVIACFGDGSKMGFQVFNFDEGRLYNRDSFIVDCVSEDRDALAEFIVSYYSSGRSIPQYVTLHSPCSAQTVTAQWLSEKKGRRVYLTVPQKGEQRALAQMCRQNAAELLAQTKGTTGDRLSVLEELRDILGLETLPGYIEAYDISNLAGSENVAGMVVYDNGRPKKSAYKKFKIKSFEGQDDYASMYEVLKRRLEEYAKAQAGEKDADAGFARLPDLILLDGGLGQVTAVRPLLTQYGIDVPLFGMVKDDHHRTRAIVCESGETEISRKRRVFSFISGIQDEVHRFSVGYHRSARSRTMLRSSLTDIDGIGTERAKALLRYFKSVKNIANAELSELENAPKMTVQTAAAVYNYFRGKNS